MLFITRKIGHILTLMIKMYGEVCSYCRATCKRIQYHSQIYDAVKAQKFGYMIERS